MPWIVFFQNVDAIIGHEEPVIYPEHLTRNWITNWNWQSC